MPTFLTSAAAQMALNLLIANLPQAITTGEQVFAFVTAGMQKVISEFSGSQQPATEDDVKALLSTEALQELQIEALK